MKDTIELSHERVDDIPLISGLAQQLHLPERLDHHLGNHGHHQGVSNGWLTTIWLASILTEGDHRKSSVQDWVDRHQHTLEQLVQQPLRAGECNDDRLGIVLRRLSCPAAWQGLEAELWASTVTVYEVAVAGGALGEHDDLWLPYEQRGGADAVRPQERPSPGFGSSQADGGSGPTLRTSAGV